MTEGFVKKKRDSTRWVRFRILLVATILAICFGIILGRAVQLQVLDRSELSERAAGQYKKAFCNKPRRGTIFDRHYKELAVSIEVSSICAYPKQVSDPDQTAAALAGTLNLRKSVLAKKLSSDRAFVWVKRQADPKDVSAVKKLKLRGIGFVRESRRFYPLKTVAGQVIGICGTDGKGLEGLEYYYDSSLSGRESNWTIFRDALGRSFTVEAATGKRKDGHNLILTIDKNIQYIAEQALARGVEAFSAKSGVAVVMVPRTGAILAMAHVPQFNPNAFEKYEPWLWRNRAITDTFEPGSTFKVFLAAAALESGLCTPYTRIYCEKGNYRVGKLVVHDIHPRGTLSLQDILKYSSNIGAAKIGERIGSAYFYRKLREFGFGEKTGIDCPGESAGNLLPFKRWSHMDALAICFGQGVSVSALQIATALSAIANDGVLMKPYLVQAMTDRSGRIIKNFRPSRVRRVISSTTARLLTRMLERVVAKGGTGVKAALSGYRVAGKTGTAQKADPEGKGYAKDRHTASFIGFVPAGKPEVVVVVVIDEPEKDRYGGVVAAPVFRQIARETLQYLKIPPELRVPEGKYSASLGPPEPESGG
ncbi:MAG: penicillin-binding protein 2 [Deltaproteobacteria bacterium]|nr:penicillin-binding protein 2 [Deltaproteobacteria bacterium]RLB91797.1 MAG: penicillin-binding protein 2 [Deltaproteobacteria bacterium]